MSRESRLDQLVEQAREGDEEALELPSPKH